MDNIKGMLTAEYLIFMHLDRMSMLLTTMQNENNFNRDINADRHTALKLATIYLASLVPSRFKDDEYIKRIAEINQCVEREETDLQLIEKLRAVIDLLHRKNIYMARAKKNILPKTPLRDNPKEEEFILEDEDGTEFTDEI